MTVCGEKVTGVCVAEKCPHFKRCCPTVWDKYGKIKPKTNEEWLRSATTEQLAEFLNLIIRVGPYENEPKDFWEHVYGYGGEHGAKSIVTWLKQPHTNKE